jgi:hypothetical protein
MLNSVREINSGFTIRNLAIGPVDRYSPASPSASLAFATAFSFFAG